MIMSEWSVNLTTLFLGRVRPHKWLTSISFSYFGQKLTTALLESAMRPDYKILEKMLQHGFIRITK